MSVLIVDDQPPFRDVARRSSTWRPASTSSARPSPARTRSPQAADVDPDLVLMDINLPGHQRHRGHPPDRRRRAPATVVILLSTYDADDLPEDAPTPAARRAYVHKEDFSPVVLRDVWDDSRPAHLSGLSG